MKIKYVLSSIIIVMVIGYYVYSGSVVDLCGRGCSCYSSLLDTVADKGQYWHLEMKVVPRSYVSCVGVAHNGTRNRLNTRGNNGPNGGFQGFITAQSAAGLINRAVEAGEIDCGVLFKMSDQYIGDKLSKEALNDMGAIELGNCEVENLIDGSHPQFANVFKGYILTDVLGNIESSVYANVASHVMDYVIIDKRDEAYYNAIAGDDSSHYLHQSNRFDATKKRTQDGWDEFKGECNNKALVLISSDNGELRDFAISHGLFVINIEDNKNRDLLDDVLAWLEPNSLVYGWEGDAGGEKAFVEPISKYGHMMVPSDILFNTNYNAVNYSNRQDGMYAHSDNPRLMNLEEDQDKKIVSFYLSDGDNVQWMMNGFVNSTFYLHADASRTKMSFGIPSTTLPMMVPAQMKNIFDQQPSGCTLVEALGGGYPYVDLFGSESTQGREVVLANLAEGVAAHMRQHNVKVLGLFTCNDTNSDGAKQAYEAYIKANDQLEGVVVIEYAPYAGGEGEIMWVENSAGYHIPIVTVRYALWANSNGNQGNPDDVASMIRESDMSNPFSVVAVHAWSGYNAAGTEGYGVGDERSRHRGPGAAQKCAELFSSDDTKVVNLQEMMWRIRMNKYPEETRKFLSTID